METKLECTAPSVRLGEKTYPCTIAVAMDLIGGKWKAVILYHLKEGEKRFSELKKDLYSVTDGLISKVVYGEKPPLVAIYSLTDLGKSFLPILDALTQWGNKIVLEKGTFLTE